MRAGLYDRDRHTKNLWHKAAFLLWYPVEDLLLADKQQLEVEKQRLEIEKNKRDAKLRELGIDPDTL